MGQFLSNKYLKYRAAMKGGPVSGDLPCDQCSYNLRGLRFGGACPECGTPITLRGDGDLAFHDMPLPVIKRFRASAWAATFSMLGFILLLVFYNKLASTLIPVRLLLLALIILWLFAVWRLTPAIELAQAARYGFSQESKLRFVARWFQFGWVFTALAVYFVVSGVRSGFFWYISLFCFFGGIAIGLIGLVGLCLFLARFADWVRDEFAEMLFKLAVWGNLLAIPLTIFLSNIIFSMGPFTIILASLFLLPIVILLLASLLAFPLGLLSLSRSVDWSIVHSKEKAAKDRALREKMAPRPAPLPETPEQIELSQIPANPEQISPLLSSDLNNKENT